MSALLILVMVRAAIDLRPLRFTAMIQAASDHETGEIYRAIEIL